MQSIKNYINGVRVYHLFMNVQFPDISHVSLQLTYKGLSKLLFYSPHQAPPITPEILLKIRSLLDPSSIFQTSLWCLFLFCFYMMCRKSSIVPPTKTAFDSNKFLSRNDVVCTPFGLLVTLKYSKTNQHGDNNVVIPLHANPGSSLCPVQAFNDMCAKNPVNSSDPLFCYLNQGRLVPFDADTVDNRLKS